MKENGFTLLKDGKKQTISNRNSYFFQAVAISVLLYGCTTWTLMKTLGEKARWELHKDTVCVLNKSWKQHPTKQQLYDHLAPISHDMLNTGEVVRTNS